MVMDLYHSDIFQNRLSFLKESQWFSKEDQECYQTEQFKKLMAHVFAHVPYYQKLFHSLRLTVSEFNTLEDLAKIPLLTKQIIQENYDELIPTGVDKETLYSRSTGGSTGTPLTVYMDAAHVARDKANTEYYMNVAGLNIFDFKSIRLYGDKVPQEVLDRGEYGYVVDGRKLVMSCYHITKETAPAYVRQINAFRPKYIHSRPSGIFPLGQQMMNLGLKLAFRLEGIFLDGEMLPGSQRDLLEEAFGCRVYLIYGHTEGCCVGFSCPESRYMHFMPQVGILELLRPDGSRADGEGEKGDMVVTGFNNYAFPLIRYRTFDIGVNTNRTCPCGRQFSLLKRVEGRVQDYAINRSGAAIPVAPAVFNYNDMDWKGIRQFQVLQECAGELIFKIVRESDTAEGSEEMAQRLLREFGLIFGGMFQLSIRYVDEIPRTRIGKFRYLDQRLDMSAYQLAV